MLFWKIQMWFLLFCFSFGVFKVFYKGFEWYNYFMIPFCLLMAIVSYIVAHRKWR